jgi:hypothetical protein
MSAPLDISCAKGGRAIANDVDFDPCRAFHVGTGGNASVVFNDGSSAVLKGLQAGVTYAYSIKRVNASGTTAADLVALY